MKTDPAQWAPTTKSCLRHLKAIAAVYQIPLMQNPVAGFPAELRLSFCRVVIPL